MKRDRDAEKEALAHFELNEAYRNSAARQATANVGKCPACEDGPSFRHNWKPGQCKHASEKEVVDEWVMPKDDTVVTEIWPPYDC